MDYSSILNQMNSSLPPLPGQVKNAAGGYYYAIDCWAQLDRFLLCGTSSGTYYVGAVDLTKQNVQAINECLSQDYRRTIDRVVEMSIGGRIPKNDTALFVLAIAGAYKAPPEFSPLDFSIENIKDAEDYQTLVRQYALSKLPEVARTASHLLMFVDFITKMRGWGSSLKKAVGDWFVSYALECDSGPERLAYQAVKYYQRNGYSLRDLLRLSHPWDNEERYTNLIKWILNPKDLEAAKNVLDFPIIKGKLTLETIAEQQIKDGVHFNQNIIDVIKGCNLPREAIPTQFLNYKEVWDALLETMPITAMIRNLGKMSNVGTIDPFGNEKVVATLTNENIIKKGRIHPLQVLIAQKTYAQGHGDKGSLSWSPSRNVVEALDKAFELSYVNAEPTNKKIFMALDISGSMDAPCSGNSSVKAYEAAAALGAMFARIEPNFHSILFHTACNECVIPKNVNLSMFANDLGRIQGGGTDLSQPLMYLLDKKLVVDAIIIVTDNETWAGRNHAQELFHKYMAEVNPNVKAIIIALSANNGQVLFDDKMGNVMGIGGFDSNVHLLVSEFLKD